MPTEIKLWKIEDDSPRPVDRDKLNLESRLEDWIRRDISLVNDDLLVIGQQVPTEHTGDIDLLAIDSEANLVILELKRDRTPRDIVAQTLDYASHVQNLGLSDIQEIAASSDFFDGKSLEEAFREKFGFGLPGSVNHAHRMYIVASSLDSSTERIVGYLSETHGVDINVATFAYFKADDGRELLGRSFLLDEGVVERRAEIRRTSKRREALTQAEFRDIAEKNGVLDLWDKAMEEIRPISQGRGRSLSSLYFQGKPGPSGRRTSRSFISLFPGDSSGERGLAISLRREKLEEDFNLTVDKIVAYCELSDDSSVEEVGTGSTYLFDADRLDRLIELLKQNAPQGLNLKSKRVVNAITE